MNSNPQGKCHRKAPTSVASFTPFPLVSSHIRTNLLITVNFMRNFFFIIGCGIYSLVQRWTELIGISLLWSMHRCLPQKGRCFMCSLFLVITELTQPNNHIPETHCGSEIEAHQTRKTSVRNPHKCEQS